MALKLIYHDRLSQTVSHVSFGINIFLVNQRLLWISDLADIKKVVTKENHLTEDRD